MSDSIKLTRDEIQAAFDTPQMREQFPQLMNVETVARMVGKSAKTIYNWVESGRLKGAVRRQGKSLYFWRDRVIDRIFNGPNWADQPNHKEEE